MKKVLERIYAASPAALQTLALNAYGWKIRHERFNDEYRLWQRIFAENERRPPAELAAMQDRAVRDLIGHAYEKVPYYRDAMRERKLEPRDSRRSRSPSSISRTSSIPIDASCPRTAVQDLEGNSSGTTGSPITVLWDRRVEVANNAANWRARRWAGFDFGMPYASLLGRTIVPIARTEPPFWRWNAPWRQLLLSSFHLQEKNLPLYLDAMRARRCQFLDAYPSTAYILARHLVGAGRPFPCGRSSAPPRPCYPSSAPP
jgi:phenylacetate-CoA ligase